MKTSVHLPYLAQVFLQWGMFQTRVVEKIKTRVLYSAKPPPPPNRAVYENVEKYGGASHATDGNVIRQMRTACWISKVTDTQTV
jgi:hypothetical protein